MEIKLDITPEAIERQVVDAVVKSGIGKRIESAVTTSLNGYNFSRAIDDAVMDAIKDITKQEILSNTVLRESVRTAITAQITEKHLNELLRKALDLD